MNQGGFVEFSGTVRAVLDDLEEEGTAGALIVGGAGSGKSTMIRRVLDRIPSGTDVIRLAPTRMLASIPFGTLGPYLEGLPVEELDSSAAVIRAFTQLLRSKPSRPLLVVDDAHHLDAGTLKLVAQAVATGAATLLASSLPVPSMPEELLALWDAGIATKHDLAPFTVAQVHEFCQRNLDANVSPWISRLFAAATAGIPFQLKSLLDRSAERQTIGARFGQWVLLDRPDFNAAPAADIIDSRLKSLPAEEQAVASIVCSAGALPLGVILRYGSPRSVDTLEAAGIIAVAQDGDRLVRPSSLMVSEVVRQRIPAGRSVRLRASLLALSPEKERPPEAFLSCFRWALDTGTTLSPEELLFGSAAANAEMDQATALRAATGVADLLPEARIQLAYSQFVMGRRREAGELLACAGPVRAGRSALLAELLAGRLGTGGAAATAGSGDPQSDAVRMLVDRSHRAEILSARGQVVSGMELGRKMWSQAQELDNGFPLVYEDLLARYCLTLVRGGEWAEAERIVADYVRRAPLRLPRSGGLLHVVQGYNSLRQARFAETWATLAFGIAELTVSDPWGVLPLANVLAAYAARMTGRQADADDHSRRFRKDPGSYPESLRLLADAYCTVAEGGEGTGDSLRRIADAACRRRLCGVEAEVLRLALSEGTEALGDTLATCSAALEGREGRLLSLLARVVSAPQASMLAELSDQALESGFPLLALEASRYATGMAARNPQWWRPAATIDRRLQQRLLASGIAEDIGAVRIGKPTNLTEREAEVLDLVGRGASNAEIAAALTLSSRTVEGHLYRIFTKLGVSRRAELVEDAAPTGLPDAARPAGNGPARGTSRPGPRSSPEAGTESGSRSK